MMLQPTPKYEIIMNNTIHSYHFQWIRTSFLQIIFTALSFIVAPLLAYSDDDENFAHTEKLDNKSVYG